MASPTHIAIRPEWLATEQEDVLDPQRPIIDSHHHLYDRPGVRYLLDDYLRDTSSGHNVRASVFVQARAMLRADAPVHLQSLGETEFVNGVAAASASGIYGNTRVCAGIVGYADLLMGDDVRPVLERHIAAAGGLSSNEGRFCGIRQTLSWDTDATLLNAAYPTTKHMADSNAFRAGFAHLAPLGLSFEAWVFFHQLPVVASLARAFPETRIVLNHCGGIVRIARYASEREEVYYRWRSGMTELAQCPNVMVKLSGLGMRLGGFDFETRDRAPRSSELAAAWRPWIEGCVETFGSDRCMYGSNFPVDKGSYSYRTGLNALKLLFMAASEDAKDDVFWRSAKSFYRLRIRT